MCCRVNARQSSGDRGEAAAAMPPTAPGDAGTIEARTGISARGPWVGTSVPQPVADQVGDRQEELHMRVRTVSTVMAFAAAVSLSGCATSEEWAEWKSHSTHFASDQHMGFSHPQQQGRVESPRHPCRHGGRPQGELVGEGAHGEPEPDLPGLGEDPHNACQTRLFRVHPSSARSHGVPGRLPEASADAAASGAGAGGRARAAAPRSRPGTGSRSAGRRPRPPRRQLPHRLPRRCR